MTISEMHIAFGLKLDMVDSLNYIDINAEEKDYWLNQAILAFVNDRFTGYKGDGFEESEKRIEDLRVLVENGVLTPTTHTMDKPNAYYFNLDDLKYEYWLNDEEEVTIKIGTTLHRVGIIECYGDQYRWFIDNPFSEHKLRYGKAKPLRMFLGNYVEIVTDGNYSVENYHIRYLRKPAQVSYPLVSCDLLDICHPDIVDMAVRMAVASLGDQTKYQIKLNEEQRNLN